MKNIGPELNRIMTERRIVRKDIAKEVGITPTYLSAIVRKNSIDCELLDKGEFYQFNLSSCIRQQNSLTAQFVSFSLANLANIFYPPPIFTIINLCLL